VVGGSWVGNSTAGNLAVAHILDDASAGNTLAVLRRTGGHTVSRAVVVHRQEAEWHVQAGPGGIDSYHAALEHEVAPRVGSGVGSCRV
jgi:hypothetical protein